MKSLYDYHRFAIIETAFLGDIALSLFVAKRLKELHPSCWIVFLTTPSAAELVRLCANVDEVIEYDKRKNDRGLAGILRMGSRLRALKLDCVLQLHRSVRSTIVSSLSGADVRVGYQSAGLSILLTDTIDISASESGLHAIEKSLRILLPFRENNSNIAEPSRPDFELTDSLLKLHSLTVANQVDENRLIAIAPGSVWATKRWDKNRYVELATFFRESDYSVVVIGGVADKELCDEIARFSNTTSLAGKITLPQTLALLTLCRAVITNDSAPTHLATLVNCPTATIYGPTVPEFGFGPRADRSTIVEPPPLSCRPCSSHGPQICPIGTHECMNSIATQDVLNSALRLID